MTGSYHFITGEYPPDVGGVADYCRQVAQGVTMETGREVHVWCPGREGWESFTDASVVVHKVGGGFEPRSFAQLSRELDRTPSPRRIIVQWVPHAFGWRSMNIPLCCWVYGRSRRGDHVELMVHEPFLMFGEGTWKQDVAAGLHRVMIFLLLRSARKVWYAIPEWERLLTPFAPAAKLDFEWLPVPSNVPVSECPDAVARLRSNVGITIGHFGTYGRPISAWLIENVPILMNSIPQARLCLLGRGSDLFRDTLLNQHPALRCRVTGAGVLAPADLSGRLQACDVMLQPYPAGINSRQGSAMACLAHGVPVVSTIGRVTEPFWYEHDGVLLGQFHEPASVLAHVTALCADTALRRATGQKGFHLYETVFHVRHTVAKLIREKDRLLPVASGHLPPYG